MSIPIPASNPARLLKRGMAIVFATATALVASRVSAATATNVWTGTGDGTSWVDPGNWKLNRAPGEGDAVVIDANGTNTVVRLAVDGGSVRRINSTATMLLAGGSLRVTEGASRFKGPVTLDHSALRGSGAGARLDVDLGGKLVAATIATDAGAVIQLATANAYDGVDAPSLSLAADGTGSAVQFPALAQLQGTTARFATVFVGATRGGLVSMPVLTHLTNGAVELYADGTGSRIEVQSLAEAQGVAIDIRNGATVVCPAFVRMKFSSLQVIGPTTTMPVDQFISVDGSTIYAVGGAALEFPGLDHFDALDVGSVTLRADGVGSALDFPLLSDIRGATARFAILSAEAINGGHIGLSLVTEVTLGSTQFYTDRPGSVMDLDGLTRLHGGALEARGGAQLLCPNLTTLEAANLIVRNPDTKIGLAKIMSVTGTSLHATDGAVATFPLLAAYDAGEDASETLEAVGAASALEFPAVTALRGARARFAMLNILALSGGTVRLPLLVATTDGYTQFYGDGAGSKLTLPKLATIDGNYLEARFGTTVECPALAKTRNATLISRGPTTVLPVAQITDADGSNLYATDGATLNFTGLNHYDAGTITSPTLQSIGAGSVLAFPFVADFRTAQARFATLAVAAFSGGTLRLPMVASVTTGYGLFLSDGTGSLVDLPTLNQIVGQALEARGGGTLSMPLVKQLVSDSLTMRGPTTSVTINQITAVHESSLAASDGSVVSFAGLTTFDSGPDGNGSTIESVNVGTVLSFPVLSSVQGATARFALSQIRAVAGGHLLFPAVHSLEAGSISVLASGTDTGIGLPVLTRISGMYVEGSAGGRIDAPSLAEVYGGSLVAGGSGSITTLGITTAVATGIRASDGAVLRFPLLRTYDGRPGNVRLEAAGAGSILDLSSITELWGSQTRFSGALSLDASAGATLLFGGVTHLDTGAYSVDSNGTNSLVKFGPITTAHAVDFSVENGGRIEIPSLRSIVGGSLSLFGGGIFPADQLVSVQQSRVTVNGMAVAFDRLTDAGTTSFGYQLGGSATFPPASDLRVTAITVPTTGLAGHPLSVGWTVTNASALAVAGVRHDGFALRRGGFPDWVLGTIAVDGTLPANGESHHTGLLILPDGIAGTWQLVVTADAGFEFYEGDNEGNNSRVSDGTITLASSDLVTEHVVLPAGPVTAGVPFEIRWVVANTGTTNANAVWRDALLLGTNAVDFTVSTTLATVPRPAVLKPGERYTNAMTVAVPFDVSTPPGPYFVAVVANADHAQPEATEANNSATAALAVIWPPLPDLAVLSVASEAQTRPGAIAAVQYQVKNLGTAAASLPWKEAVFLQFDGTPPDLAHPLAVFDADAAIGPGATVGRVRSVPIPSTIQPSSNARFVVVANLDRTIVETDFANNQGTAANPTVIPVALDLAFAQDRVREDTVPPVVVARLARNGPTDQALQVTLAFAPPGPLSAPATVTIPAGQSAVSVPFTVVPDGIAGPDRPIVVTAKAAGRSDGTATILVVNTDAARLTLAFATPQVAKGQTVSATVTRNAGTNAPLSVHFASTEPARLMPPADLVFAAGQLVAHVAFVAADNLLLLPPEIVAASVSAAGYAGATDNVTVIEGSLPVLSLSLSRTNLDERAGPMAAVATVTRVGRLDFPLVVALSSTNTNAVVVPEAVLIPAGSDSATFFVGTVSNPAATGNQTSELRAVATYTTSGEPVGYPARATVRVTDNESPGLSLVLSRTVAGTGHAAAVTATLKRSPVSAGALAVTLAATPQSLVAVPPVVTIPAGAASVDFPIDTLPSGPNAGSHPVAITATSAGFNPGSATLVVTDLSKPDLIVEAVTAPSSAVTGGQAGVGWRVRNQGLAAATGKIRQLVYLSADNRLDPDDVVIADQTIDGTLGPDVSVAFSRTVFLPEQPGDYWVFVRVDPDDTFDEIDEDNNVGIVATPITVGPSFLAKDVSVKNPTGPSGQPVEIRGRLVRPDGSPAAFEIAAVYVRHDGTERVVGGESDENGLFVATFRPAKDEAGFYEVAVAHPRVANPPATAQFVLFGLLADPASLRAMVPLGGQSNVVFHLRNPGPTPLTGLAGSGVGLPTGVTLTAVLPTTIAAGGQVDVNAKLSAGNAPAGRTDAVLRLTSAEGARLDVPLAIVLAPAVPQLHATPDTLVAGAVRGRQTVIRFAVTNNGAAASGAVGIALPDVPWLASASPTTRPSLDPGAGTEFEVLFTPTADQALGEYKGQIGLVAEGFATTVPFSVRLVSDATGDLEIVAEDEYTYYAAGAPKLAGALAELLDAYTGKVLRTATTDTNGFAKMTTVAEGDYRLRMTAPKHKAREVAVHVQPGLTNRTRVLVPVDGVAYTWSVVPTDVPDRYQFALETKFEANVPFPLVTAIEPEVFPIVFPGQATTMNITFTNHGLIAAKALTVRARSTGTYLITPLFTDLGDLPAKSSISVPVRVEFQPDLDARIVAGLVEQGRPVARSGRRGAGLAAGGGGGGGNNCEEISLDAVYLVVCGSDGLFHIVSIDVKPVAMLKELAKCLKALAKGPGNVGGAACDCLGQAVAGIGAALGGSGELPPDLKCVAAFLCLDVEGMARCICPGLEGEGDTGAVYGGAIPVGNYVPPPGGGSGNCSIIPTGAAPGASASLAYSPQTTSSGDTVALVMKPTPRGASVAIADNSRRGTPRPAGDGGICAQVRLLIVQDAVLTRAGFSAALGIDNRSPDTGLTDLGFQLEFTDANGRSANALFEIRGPVLGGITSLDGTGQLAAGTAGTAQFTIVPSVDAAPLGATPYAVGGTLHYTDATGPVTIRLAPAPISVLPQPRLTVDYYNQRDVYSDDPFTPEIEPAEPYTLAVMLRNTGAGSARSVSIESAQPKIIENAKGLLIDFSILGTEVFDADGTRELVPSLVADFGDIAPGEVAIGRWLLRSTLQGFFVDYSATFKNRDPLGVGGFSAIDPNGVHIHEMTHLVNDPRSGADALPDFLVNEDPATDPDHLPDTVHLSTGAVEPVVTVLTATADDAVSTTHRQISVAIASGNGWIYARVPDPQGGQGQRKFRLVGVTRDDGTVLPASNFWQTDRTFVGVGRRPVRENLLHLFDHGPSASYRLVYEPIAPTDTTAPVSAVDALPSMSFDRFPVSWDGTDGSGPVAAFDVYVAEDDGPFALWLGGTTLRGGLYEGAHGHRYAFYSLATDAAGNRELPPGVPQAVTTTALQNGAPHLAAIPPQSVIAGRDFVLGLSATDPDGPGQTLEFSLGAGSPVGMTVEPDTGLVRWTAPRALGGTTRHLVVSVTDDGVPPLSDTISFDLAVIATNSPPVLAGIKNRVVTAGALVTFVATASDDDAAPGSLRFALGAGAPAGATIDAVSGVFRWQTAEFAAGSTNTLTISVTDDGLPKQSDQQAFVVVVRKRANDFRLEVGSTQVRAGNSSSVPLHLVAGIALGDLEFVLPSPGPGLVDLSIEPLAPALLGAQIVPRAGGGYGATFFVQSDASLDGELDLARIHFDTPVGLSTVAVLSPTDVGGVDATGVRHVQGTSGAGKVFVVDSRPLADVPAPGRLVVHGLPGKTYRLEFADTLGAAAVWTPGPTVSVNTETGEAAIATDLPARFIRLREL